MITNKDDFTKKRKTRVELLEERIISAEKLVRDLKTDLGEDGKKEISKLESVLVELREMKANMIKIETENKKMLDADLGVMKQESLLIINNDKIRIQNENERLITQKKEKDEVIHKMKEEIAALNLALAKAKMQENKMNEQNSILEDKFKNLQSKAYGFDIAKKFEIHQNKLNNEKKNKVIIDDNPMAYNFWERENTSNKQPSRLEDLTKQKGLWIGNPTSNLNKLMQDVNKSSNYEENNSINKHYSQGSKPNLYTNMRKISPLILGNNNMK